jgi:hypothetical protein
VLASHPAVPVTRVEAARAIHARPAFYGQRVLTCAQLAAGQSCQVGHAGCYDDQVFGPSLLVASETVLVTRDGRRYRVRQTTPDTFQVYAGCSDD